MNLFLNELHDIVLDGRTMRRHSGTSYSAQTAKTNLHLQEGEWIVDPNEGLPWLSGALDKGVPLPLVAQLIKSTVENTVGVLSVDSLEYDFDKGSRKLNVSFAGTTVYGKTFVGVLNQ